MQNWFKLTQSIINCERVKVQALKQIIYTGRINELKNLELRNSIFPRLIAPFCKFCNLPPILDKRNRIVERKLTLALTKILLNFDRENGWSFSRQIINCSWRCQSWWTINIKVKAVVVQQFVPVASSVHRLLRWYDVTLYMLVAACLHAPIYPSMDAGGLIVSINYEVLDVYRARPTVIFGSVMWNMARERV